MVAVRYLVDDVEAAKAFYTEHLGFRVEMAPSPQFAMLAREQLRLYLDQVGAGGGGTAGMADADGASPAPGGWNRFQIAVDDLDGVLARLRADGVTFRGEMVSGIGGRQILVEDPSGNPVELFEPAGA